MYLKPVVMERIYNADTTLDNMNHIIWLHWLMITEQKYIIWASWWLRLSAKHKIDCSFFLHWLLKNLTNESNYSNIMVCSITAVLRHVINNEAVLRNGWLIDRWPIVWSFLPWNLCSHDTTSLSSILIFFNQAVIE